MACGRRRRLPLVRLARVVVIEGRQLVRSWALDELRRELADQLGARELAYMESRVWDGISRRAWELFDEHKGMKLAGFLWWTVRLKDVRWLFVILFGERDGQ